MSEPQLLHWRERAFVTPAVAGLILAYSPSYIRRLVAAGVLKGVRQTKGGPLSIVVDSIVKYVDSAPPLHAPERIVARQSHKHRHLTVVQ